MKNLLLRIWAGWLLAVLLSLAWPGVARAQFTITTNNGAITITGYTGVGGDVVIPSTINGLQVTAIGLYAFYNCNNLTKITIPDSVTFIASDAFAFCTNLTDVTMGASVSRFGDYAFSDCTKLSRITLPDSVTNMGNYAFNNCYSLTNASVGNGVTSLGSGAFYRCTNLTTVTIGKSVVSLDYVAFGFCSRMISVVIPNSVTNVSELTFIYCTNLTGVYFSGNSPTPTNDTSVFGGATNASVYYLPGMSGWGPSFDGRPTALWFLPNPLILNQNPSFGVQNNQFGFTISWATNVPVVVEASVDLANWSPVSTNTLTVGTSYFSDPQWANYPSRFYRLRAP